MHSTKYKRASAMDLFVAEGDIGSMGGPNIPDIKLPEKDYKVLVNEDYLFNVDIKHRDLAPVYWDGPVYDVIRGTWFFQG